MKPGRAVGLNGFSGDGWVWTNPARNPFSDKRTTNAVQLSDLATLNY